MTKSRDEFTRRWITDNAINIYARYAPGVLTLRGLHYQLVALGMTNSVQHYKRVVSAMIEARRAGIIPYYQFSDHDCEAIGSTEASLTDLDDAISTGKRQVEAWMTNYSRNRWENQPKFVECWIEKKALQGVFQDVCERNRVALCPCKGYPSLTFLYEASQRFREAEERGQDLTIVYFGDHDPSSEDIPRSISENFDMGFRVYVDVQVIALTEDQCLELGLPPAPIKASDSRSANFAGLGQIELDAVKPEMLDEWAENAIKANFNNDLHVELLSQQEEETFTYRQALHDHVTNMK